MSNNLKFKLRKRQISGFFAHSRKNVNTFSFHFASPTTITTSRLVYRGSIRGHQSK